MQSCRMLLHAKAQHVVTMQNRHGAIQRPQLTLHCNAMKVSDSLRSGVTITVSKIAGGFPLLIRFGRNAFSMAPSC